MRARRRGGFTLIELLIVVAIIGVLSAIAIPSFMSYVQRSYTSEAIVFLGEIRQRQEAYRAEHGQYCAVSGSDATSGAWAPEDLPTNGEQAPWGDPEGWDQLGASPDGMVRFQYRTSAGSPGAPNGIPGYDGSDFWFVAQAQGDLDGDGEVVIFEAYSEGNNIFIGDESMQPLPSGYE
jgi:prepilin-type N-terminal cleavage/methylation domain-containing protein